MVKPTFADYVDLLFNLFERFLQHHSARPHRGHPFVYEHKALIVFFVVMQKRRIFRFKAQHRWLKRHPETRKVLGLDEVPHRTTLLRRYTTLYAVLYDFIAFLGHYAEALDPRLTSQDLYTDKSLFKAQGPVWHQSDGKEGRIPGKLRHLDTDGSGYGEGSPICIPTCECDLHAGTVAGQEMRLRVCAEHTLVGNVRCATAQHRLVATPLRRWAYSPARVRIMQACNTTERSMMTLPEAITIHDSLGVLVRTHREALGLTQQALARACRLSPVYIS